jgi:citrate synthase
MSDTNSRAWQTAVTEIKPNHIAVRGYDIADLMGNVSVGQAVYLILRGEMPSDEIGRLMDAILVSSIDHGATPPSVLAARTVASTGASLIEAVAAGIMSINKLHGGAIQDCAIQLKQIIDRAATDNQSLDEAAKTELADMKSRGERMSGFGHRFHTADPRTTRLLELAEQAGVSGEYLDAAEAVRKAFEDAGKKLPINIDGAIGAVLAQLGFDPAVMNGLFMIARTPGLVAHVIEEQTREKKMRTIDPVDHSYDGPDSRTL